MSDEQPLQHGTPNNEPGNDQAMEATYAYAAERMAAGNSNHEIRGLLVEQGLSEGAAGMVLSNLARMKSKATHAAAKKNMIYGALWCVGGIAVTAFTYGAASGGDSYIVAWGAIVFGGFQFLRGLAQAFE